MGSKFKSNPLDLSKSIPNVVVSNQEIRKGQKLFFEYSGLVNLVTLGSHLDLAKRFSNRIKGELEWFESFVSHSPSVGGFYEHLIRMAISDVLPSRWKLGEGFIYDSNREVCSKQLDLIVYSDNDIPPIYRRDSFVVVSPKSVVAVGEVKKSLRSSDIREQIKATISSNFGTYENSPNGVSRLNIFCYKSSTSTSRIVSVIKEEIEAFITNFKSTTKSGSKVTLGCCNMVLPCVFFLDRSECIFTQLTQNSSLNEKVIISVLQGDREDSLHFFLESMSAAENNGVASGDRSFLTMPLRNVKQEISLPEPLFCVRNLTMEEISNQFPKEVERLKGLSFKGQRPFGANVNARTDLKKLSNLSELIALPGFQWALMQSEMNA